jgi:hypothetical protein
MGGAARNKSGCVKKGERDQLSFCLSWSAGHNPGGQHFGGGLDASHVEGYAPGNPWLRYTVIVDSDASSGEFSEEEPYEEMEDWYN